MQQNTEVFSRKRRNDEEELYQENWKRHRERVQTGKAYMDVEGYITMYRYDIDAWKFTTIRPGNRDEL